MVTLKTNHGDITVELLADDAPISTKNFLEYATEGHYDGTIFHRVISGFMIQGGGFVPGMTQKQTKAPIENESSNGVKNAKYTLAMARTSVPDSATCQFFINVADNRFLDRDQCQDGVGYAVFGKVTAGEEVVDKIAAVDTGVQGGMQDVPNDDVIIESVQID